MMLKCESFSSYLIMLMRKPNDDQEDDDDDVFCVNSQWINLKVK